MRYATRAKRNYFPALIRNPRRWLAAICIVVLGAVSATGAKATPDPAATGSLTSVDAAVLAYYTRPASDDPEQAEAYRQFILWCIWELGGNPWKLDPTWIIPGLP